MVVLNVTFLWWLSPCKKELRLLDSFHRYWWSKNHSIWLDERHNWPDPTKEVVLDATFVWWLSSCKTSKRLLDFLHRYRWPKNPAIWLDDRHNWPHPTKNSSLGCHLFDDYLHAKNLKYQFRAVSRDFLGTPIFKLVIFPEQHCDCPWVRKLQVVKRSDPLKTYSVESNT